MEKRTQIKIGCLTSLLAVFVLFAFIAGKFYYRILLKRCYVEIEGYKTITIWKNNIIFDRYWFPFRPKENYIRVMSTWDNYYLNFTVTQDSTLGIWSNYPVEVYKLKDYKSFEVYENNQQVDWVKRFSFANATEPRKDSLILEMGFRMWYPCYIQYGTYAYRTDDGIVKKNFDNGIIY